ncbi:MAG: leucine-rich repeat domain-containing protein [Duncaniella sp.]|nr:leucine-rich repeat domain-containing protein [Duncaniella sp.]
MTLRTLIITAAGVLQALSARSADVVLSGPVDAAALHAVATSGQTIGTLDLSGAVITAYDGPRLAANVAHSPANTLPAYVLSGLKATHVLLPEGLKAIADGALMGSDIEKIDIPASCDSIGMGAFASCTRLRAVTLPPSARRLGSHIFSGCTSLSSASAMGAEVPEAAFAGCTSLAEVTLGPGVRTIGKNAFRGCEALGSAAFPASLTAIGDGAFGNSGLERADLSRCTSLRTIGTEAFACCPSLVSAALPASASDIGTALFFDCTSLAEVTLPAGLASIPALTLKGAQSLRDASRLIPGGVEQIGTMAFCGMSGTTTLKLPDALAGISDEAFSGMTSLSHIEASGLSAVPALGADVFDGIDRPRTTLNVAEEMVSSFLAAPQWREFRVTSGESDAEKIHAPVTTPAVRVRFEGTTLRASSEALIASATLYDMAGRTIGLCRPSEPLAEVSIETSAQASPLFILTVTLGDGKAVSVKLIR